MIGFHDNRWNKNDLCLLGSSNGGIQSTDFEVLDTLKSPVSFRGPAIGKVGAPQPFTMQYLNPVDTNFNSSVYLYWSTNGLWDTNSKSFGHMLLSDTNRGPIASTFTPTSARQYTLMPRGGIAWLPAPDLTFTAVTPAYAALFPAALFTNIAISGYQSNPSGDGIPNLVKYAFGLDPMKSVSTTSLPIVAGTVTHSPGNLYFTLTYSQALVATDVVCTVEVSGDLQTWNSGPAYTALVNATNNPGGLTQSVTTRDLTPMSSASQRFMRLVLSHP